MTEKEKELLKKEIKEEIKEEIIDELTNYDFKNKRYSFKKYINDVNNDDFTKAKAFSKINKWYWYIPLIGWIFYQWQYNQLITNLDRGLLRKSINQEALKYSLFFIIFSWLMLVFNFFPLINKRILRKAIARSQKEQSK